MLRFAFVPGRFLPLNSPEPCVHVSSLGAFRWPTTVGAIVGGVVGGLLVVAAVVLGVLYKSGRLKTCRSCRPSSSAAVPASSGNSGAPAVGNYPEVAAPAPAFEGPGDSTGPGIQYPAAAPAVQYPEVAPFVQYPVRDSDSLPPPPPSYDDAVGI